MTDDNEFKRPPRPGEWVRVHPYEQKEIMLLHHEGKEYLVAENMVQHIREKYPDRFHELQPTMAFRTINTNNEHFLWLVPLPIPDDHPAWLAMEQWICLEEELGLR